MTRDFGKANGSWLGKQQVNPGKVSQPVSGLDSQEAAIIAQTYRKSLAPKDAKTDDKPQVLLLQQDERGRMTLPKALAPSVPKE